MGPQNIFPMPPFESLPTMSKHRYAPRVAAALLLASAAGSFAPSPASAGILSSLFKAPVTTTAATTTPATTTPAVAALPATTSTAASAACVALPTTKAFSKVDGDQSDYSVAPGGGFEVGTAGWTLSTGAKIVTGNERLGISGGSRSLQLPLGTTATSPEFCVDETNPHFRFAYKVDNASLGGFVAYVLYRNSAGAITKAELLSSKTLSLTPTAWQASPNSPLATLLPLNASTKSATVQIKFLSLNPTDFVNDVGTAILGDNAAVNAATSIAGAGSSLVATISSSVAPIANIGVSVDSVMVDPYRRG